MTVKGRRSRNSHRSGKRVVEQDCVGSSKASAGNLALNATMTKLDWPSLLAPDELERLE
jgi:hypothetical protein